MKQIFEMKDEKVIEDFLETVEYGTLAVCTANKPYSVPLNFVKVGNAFYFHGAKKGKKIDILQQNMKGSFSVVSSYSMIQSYFSSSDGLACPATQFFKSVIADGRIVFVEDREEKIMAMTALMQKLQPEGGYKPLSEDVYTKALNATMVYKLEVEELRAKFKFGQNLTQERFNMILEHLEKRDSSIDQKTTTMMQELKNEI
jgi:nitroimidazol reductase NimA-like FMN-containing flavoprotein (pyridoxamine 5'-phosphate oxidase superfamily)